jgi:hypothetical protein
MLLLCVWLPQAAVAEFRMKVLAPMFASLAADTKFWGREIKFDMASYNARTEKLAAKQLQYTLENLPPADSVGLFKVSFNTSDSGAAGSPAAPATGAGRNTPGAGIVDEAGKKAQAQPQANAQPKRL